ncbi:hypothetical protein ACN9MN_14935 [Chryseobacterium sp. S-02]|uniref:hypothetical protein n=1 Tax=Chryseobacterium sp. S-02 TaxID=3404064 RepID=UPI003CF0EADB
MRKLLLTSTGLLIGIFTSAQTQGWIDPTDQDFTYKALQQKQNLYDNNLRAVNIMKSRALSDIRNYFEYLKTIPRLTETHKARLNYTDKVFQFMRSSQSWDYSNTNMSREIIDYYTNVCNEIESWKD